MDEQKWHHATLSPDVLGERTCVLELISGGNVINIIYMFGTTKVIGLIYPTLMKLLTHVSQF